MKSKKLVYVSEEVLDEVMEVSRRRGASVGKFIEDAIRHAVRLEGSGYSLDKATEVLEAIWAQKVLGGVFVPQEAFNFMVEKTYSVEVERLKASWFECGRLYGKYLKERFKNPVGTFKSFLEATRWDLGEVEAVKEDDTVKLRCVSTVLGMEGTELLAKFVEGAVNGFGYEIKKVDCVKGIVIVEFKM